MPHFASRIHVLLARTAPVGLVIRRGPSKQVATLLWDRRDDTFQLGQWLKGRIYERRCDLSPDGKYLIYFAMNGRWNTESKGSWTAISRVPYLKAIAFYPKGDCWNGGGLWTGAKTYWLNDGATRTERGDVTLICRQADDEQTRTTTEVRRDERYSPEVGYGGECPGVYYHRLRRDGWSLVERRKLGKWFEEDLFEKRLARGWTLRKIAHAQLDSPAGKGCYWDEHELVGPDAGEPIRRPEWEWADRDGDRIIWATDGKLFAGKLLKHGLADERELHDFNEMKFEPRVAPY